MARTARRGNVLAIRPGLSIPQQRDEDSACITTARLVSVFAKSAHRLAQTEPNSEGHRIAEHMAGMGHKLPRNNLRLLVTPQQPREEWFSLAYKDYCVAKGVRDLAEARFSRAWCLDQWDKGDRSEALRAERDRAQAALDIVILDALRTPVTRKWEIGMKQQMVGKRDWAEKYRPEMQAIIDEEAARLAPNRTLPNGRCTSSVVAKRSGLPLPSVKRVTWLRTQTRDPSPRTYRLVIVKPGPFSAS